MSTVYLIDAEGQLCGKCLSNDGHFPENFELPPGKAISWSNCFKRELGIRLFRMSKTSMTVDAGGMVRIVSYDPEEFEKMRRYAYIYAGGNPNSLVAEMEDSFCRGIRNDFMHLKRWVAFKFCYWKQCLALRWFI